jgi:hypothetical protein
MEFTRRDLGKIALASVTMSRAFGAKMIDSKFGGVQIGAITYSFNRIASPDPEEIIKAYVDIGLGEAELMSNHCEALAGAPAMPAFGRGGAGRAPAAPGQAGAAPAGRADRGADPARRRRPRTLTPSSRPNGKQPWKNLAVALTNAAWKAYRDSTTPAWMSPCCYNMRDSMKDDDIEYGFNMAKGLGVKGITTSTTLTMAKRIASADKHKLLVISRPTP